MRKTTNLRGTLFLTAVLLAGCSSEQNEWDDVRTDPSVAGLEQFLAKYPESEFAEQAKSLQAEARALDAASKEGSEQALRQFISEHPDSELKAQARKRHDALVFKVLETFEPNHLLIIDDFGLVDLVRNPEDGKIQMRPMGQWRGELRYALGQQGIFTGQVTYLPPDPAAEDVAIAVIKDMNLAESLQPGHAYLWRGGDLLYHWQDISGWGSPDEIAAKLGMPQAGEYSALPAEFLAE